MCCLRFKTYLIKRRRLCRKYWKGRRCPKIIVILSNHTFTACRSEKESCQNDISKFLINVLASRIWKRDTLKKKKISCIKQFPSESYKKTANLMHSNTLITHFQVNGEEMLISAKNKKLRISQYMI